MEQAALEAVCGLRDAWPSGKNLTPLVMLPSLQIEFQLPSDIYSCRYRHVR